MPNDCYEDIHRMTALGRERKSVGGRCKEPKLVQPTKGQKCA